MKNKGDRSQAEAGPVSTTVKKVVKIGPTHAKGLRNLVGLNSAVRQGDSVDEMRLDAELSCGKAPLNIGGEQYELALRSCFLSMERENCEVRVGTRYEYWLTSGSYEANSTKREVADQSQNLGGNAGAEIDTARGLARFTANLGFGRSRKREEKSESITQLKPRVDLISASGEDRWKIGDQSSGDIRREDGLLSGVYFNERSSGDDLHPLCVLETQDASQASGLTLTVSAAFGSLVVLKEDKAALSHIVSDARKALKRRARAALNEHDALRSRIAGLAMAKHLRESQLQAGYELSENEFLIAQQSLSVIPADIVSDDDL